MSTSLEKNNKEEQIALSLGSVPSLETRSRRKNCFVVFSSENEPGTLSVVSSFSREKRGRRENRFVTFSSDKTPCCLSLRWSLYRFDLSVADLTRDFSSRRMYHSIYNMVASKWRLEGNGTLHNRRLRRYVGDNRGQWHVAQSTATTVCRRL